MRRVVAGVCAALMLGIAGTAAAEVYEAVVIEDMHEYIEEDVLIEEVYVEEALEEDLLVEEVHLEEIDPVDILLDDDEIVVVEETVIFIE